MRIEITTEAGFNGTLEVSRLLFTVNGKNYQVENDKLFEIFYREVTDV